MISDLSFVNIAIVLISIIISMTLHEAMHAFTSLWLGDDTAKLEGRITLNPVKHIDPITTVLLPMLLLFAGLPPFFAAKPVPFNPYRVRWDEFGAALVGAVGPLTNLLLAAAAAGVMTLFGGNLGLDVLNVLGIFVIVNVGFFVFNMIPFPPLDGSRVLYAFAPEPLQRVMQRIEAFGFGAIILFMLLLYPVVAPIVREITSSIVNVLLNFGV